MSNSINQEYSQGTFAYYNGQKVMVLSDNNNGFVTIRDESGQMLSIKKDALQRGCVWAFDFVDPDVVGQYDKKIAQKKEDRQVAKAYLQLCKESLANLFGDFGTRFKSQMNEEQLAQVKKAENDVYKAKSNYIARNNEYGSTLLDKFIYIT